MNNASEGLDTDPNFVDPQTGKAVGPPTSGIVSFAGPYVNPVVKYAESLSTPLLDKAPIKFYSEGEAYYFLYQNGSNVAGASLPQSVINNNQDMFLIEIYKDSLGRYIMLCYGFGNLGAHTESWIIVKWDDTNNNGFVNTPEDGDTYTVITKGN